MSEPGVDAAGDVYMVHVEQATPGDWKACCSYAMAKGFALPTHEALRAARDFISEAYRGGSVEVSYRVRVCDGHVPAAVLTLQVP